MNKYHLQRGIALFQILLMTTIIAVLALQFSQTARNQTAIARLIADRVVAELAQKSVESEIIFTLLTSSLESLAMESPASAPDFNFVDKPFSFSPIFTPKIFNIDSTNSQPKTTVSVQDLNGLISLYGDVNGALLEKLLIKFSMTNIAASTIVNSLRDWQDDDSFIRINGAEQESYQQIGRPTNMPIQFYDELANVKGMNATLAQQIYPYVTVRQQQFFNPKNSPKAIMQLILPRERVDYIASLRDNKKLTIENFKKLSGLNDDESVYFFTSGLLRIKYTTVLNEVILTKTLEVRIQPKNKYPYIEYGIHY